MPATYGAATVPPHGDSTERHGRRPPGRAWAVAFAADRTPERAAVIAPTGDRTYAELNANANRLVRALRRRGSRGGGQRGDPVVQPGRVRRDLRRPAPGPGSASPPSTGTSPRTRPPTSSATARRGPSSPTRAARRRVPPADAVRGAPRRGRRPRRLRPLGRRARRRGRQPTSTTRRSAPRCSTRRAPRATRRASARRPTPTGSSRRRRRSSTPTATSTSSPDRCTTPLPTCSGCRRRSPAASPPSTWTRWDPEETLALIERHQVTHTHVVPTMFHRLLALPDDVKARYDTSSMKVALHGAAPCPVTVKQGMIDWWGPVVWEYYGATEGAGTVVDPITWLQKPGTVGKADPDHLHVGDEEGRPPPRGRGGARVDQGHRRRPLRVLRRRRTRPTAPTEATTSRSATSGASTRTASSSSPTAPPTSSSPAA